MIEVSPQYHKADQIGGNLPIYALGFSVRSLAEAASQAGLTVYAADHFGDHDLREIVSQYQPVSPWRPPQVAKTDHPERNHRARTTAELSVEQAIVEQLLKWHRSAPVLLAGGTENWPELLAVAHQKMTVLGPTPQQLVSLRSTDFWSTAADHAKVHFPTIWKTGTPPRGGTVGWLRKSTRSAGGIHVIRCQSNLFGTNNPHWNPIHSTDYFQQEIQGVSIGVTCILRDPQKAAQARLPCCQVLGATESFRAEDWPGPSEFIYRGSWGPIRLSDTQLEKISKLGIAIQAATQLMGWLQMDFILDSDGQLWLLEINPRWTAGMEVLTACGTNPVPLHLQAWGQSQALTNHPSHGQASSEPTQYPAGCHHEVRCEKECHSNAVYFAKAVIYAEQDVDLTPEALCELQRLPRAHYADLPAWPLSKNSASQSEFELLRIQRGHPWLTVRATHLAEGTESQSEIRSRLLSRLGALRNSLQKFVRSPK